MLVQMSSSYITTIIYTTALFYGIPSIDDVFATEGGSPVVEMYRQATGTRAGALALMILLLLPLVGSSIGTVLTQSRAFWALARDGATPFSGPHGKVNHSNKVPANAIIFVTCFNTVLEAIMPEVFLRSTRSRVHSLRSSLSLISWQSCHIFWEGGRRSHEVPFM